ncbi:Hypothetical protein CINCED_3A011302 [Cinara cedri]|uniref:Uncharacterized protein n=1 Tax=Cinara cedri TaxID=506608 RepID=A0A5E4N400_9HEMI|nr:Hypothetical protein CINCED_3A011302 [Cinara cedri]
MVDIFSKFHLSNDNIVSTVTDNDCNFVKSFKEFGCKIKISITDSDTDSNEDLNEYNELSFLVIDGNEDGDILLPVLPQNLRCASHTLSLLVTTDFQNILKNSNAKKYHHPALSKCSTFMEFVTKTEIIRSY